ncbi:MULTISPECIES: hypothetical protein [Pseudomonas]|uniref:hypothetical protein n=1 Tax=Pseudomonas TaxID=286 RepID=UPI001F3B64FA|nr:MULTISPECIES: hypothetical protein [Pseudomonas]UJW20798.1 hypothetical protein L2Y89_17715 [Pseudomonas juntendi]
MNYQPKVRSPSGVDPQVRYQSGRCDVCGRSRAHHNHDKCSKARQAAGFLRWKEPDGNRKVKCVECRGEFRIDSMMGNACRFCYLAMFRQVLGIDPEQVNP